MRFCYNKCDPGTNGEHLFILNSFDGSAFWDVGAHSGTMSSFARSRYPSCKIVAIEPDPYWSESLKSIADTVFIGALSNKIGSETFMTDDVNRYGSLCYKPETHPKWRQFSVDVTTVDAMSHGGHIGFLKIDTEGSEYAVLDGAMDSLISKRIKAGSFEYGSTFRFAKHTLKDIFKLLSMMDYGIYHLCPEGHFKVEWSDSLENYEYSNWGFLPR